MGKVLLGLLSLIGEYFKGYGWPLTCMTSVLYGCLEMLKYKELLIGIRNWHFITFTLCKSE